MFLSVKGAIEIKLTDYHFCPSANKALEDKLQEMNVASDKAVGELKNRIQSLEKELDNANELLSSSKRRGQLCCFCSFGYFPPLFFFFAKACITHF